MSNGGNNKIGFDGISWVIDDLDKVWVGRCFSISYWRVIWVYVVGKFNGCFLVVSCCLLLKWWNCGVIVVILWVIIVVWGCKYWWFSFG